MPKAKGSALMRIATYFREAEFDEARMTYKLVEEIMDQRFRANAKMAESQSKAAEARPKRQGQGRPKANGPAVVPDQPAATRDTVPGQEGSTEQV